MSAHFEIESVVVSYRFLHSELAGLFILIFFFTFADCMNTFGDVARLERRGDL